MDTSATVGGSNMVGVGFCEKETEVIEGQIGRMQKFRF